MEKINIKIILETWGEFGIFLVKLNVFDLF